MPELPEVETVVRDLRDDVVGRVIENGEVFWARTIADMPPESFIARLQGQHITALWRRGKYIVFEMSDDYLLVHLRMTGRLYVTEPDTETRADQWLRVKFQMDDGYELRFSDSRKFGRMYLTADVKDVTAKLGPEPLGEDFTLEVFATLLEPRSGTLKPLLLNQAFVAGIGNIYADESLWLAGIDPRRKADTLEPDEVEKLYHSIRQALRDGIEHEGASMNWYRRPDGKRGSYQTRFLVYQREGESCPRCGTPIRKITLHQRGTHFCPLCQE